MTQQTRFGLVGITAYREVDYTRADVEPAEGQMSRFGLLGIPFAYRSRDFTSGTVKILSFTAALDADYEAFDEITIRILMEARLAGAADPEFGRVNIEVDRIEFEGYPTGRIEFETV